jgi:hypothetical protein
MATFPALSIRAAPRSTAWPAALREIPLVTVVVLLASWQVMLRSADPNGVAYQGVTNVINGTGGDLSQYRVLSAYLAFGIQHLLQTSVPPFEAIRFVQMVLIATLTYVYYGQLNLKPFTRILGVAMLGGLISLSLGVIGPSTFSLDRFDDTIFYLVAALLVLRRHDLWLPPLMLLAVANRETSVFIPMLLLARDGWRSRRALGIALAAWVVAVAVYLGIHTYYGPRPRVEESYWGTAMLMRSLGMPGQIAFFFAAINLLPALCVLGMKQVDPFLRRLFWLVVPAWFAIHIWAARLGEGIMYLAPTVIIILPLVLQALERSLREVGSAPAAPAAAE